MRRTNAQAKIKSVMESGTIVAICQSQTDHTISGRLYRVSESRGYQTDFMQKHFYYMVTFRDGRPKHIEGVTRDIRRKRFIAHCHEQKIDLQVVNIPAFDAWTK